MDKNSEGHGDDMEIDDIIPGKGKGLVVLLYGQSSNTFEIERLPN